MEKIENVERTDIFFFPPGELINLIRITPATCYLNNLTDEQKSKYLSKFKNIPKITDFNKITGEQKNIYE